MTLKRNLIFSLLTVLLIGGNAYAIDVEAEPEIGKLYGYTLYRITFTDGSGTFESELKWPVESYMGGLSLKAGGNDAYSIEFVIRKNLTSETGKMKDSDFFNDGLFIYSESDNEMDMMEWAFKGKFFNSGMHDKVSLIYGFRRQDMSFKASNVVQEDVFGGFYAQDGLVGTYAINYSMPFIGGGYEWKSPLDDSINVEVLFGYVIAKDEDDHILRFKKSTGESTGYSMSIGGGYKLYFGKRYFVEAEGNYMRISAKGKQDQEFYTGEDIGLSFKNIDLEIESAQTLVTLGAGVRF